MLGGARASDLDYIHKDPRTRWEVFVGDARGLSQDALSRVAGDLGRTRSTLDLAAGKTSATLPLRPLCGHRAHRTAANKSNGVPRGPVFSGVFARVCWPSQNMNQSGRTVRIGLLMRFSSRLLRVCDGRTGSMPGFALVQADRMPYLTYVRRGAKAFDGSDDGPSARCPDPMATCWWIP
jgi:hypothetical protein